MGYEGVKAQTRWFGFLFFLIVQSFLMTGCEMGGGVFEPEDEEQSSSGGEEREGDPIFFNPNLTLIREQQPGTEDYVLKNSTLKGDFTEDVLLEAGIDYKIEGAVNFWSGATLTIPAGTQLYGASEKAHLVINRGAKIFALGTAENPIVFTSVRDVSGNADLNDQGQWGGLVLLGSSTNSGGQQPFEGGTQKYGPLGGKATPDDSSGELSHVIIKYSGAEIDNRRTRINALTLGSVGSGTKLENIAVIGSADDGVSLLGGTANLTNLYLYNVSGDSIVTDQGYSGTLDQVLVRQILVDNESESVALQADVTFSESDQDGSESLEAEPSPEAPTTEPLIGLRPTLRNATLYSVGRNLALQSEAEFIFENVQLVVTHSSADWGSDRYHDEIAAIGIRNGSQDLTPNLELQGSGLAIRNEVAQLTLSSELAGDLDANGLIVNGKGIYQDEQTLRYFRDSVSGVKERRAVSNEMIEAGLLDSDGNPFTVEIGADNEVAGVDEWRLIWFDQYRYGKTFVLLSGEISEDLQLNSENVYAMAGQVNVLEGYSLTIPAGTTLYGLSKSSGLIINRGAQIFAEGSREAPIVMTSAEDIAQLNQGSEQGQWGGLVILGQSTISGGEQSFVDGSQPFGPKEGEASVTDSSGSLNYVAVKYAGGFKIGSHQEVGGIVLGAVGSGTQIANIVSIGSADDGIQVWGGTVDLNGLYIFNALDDGLDIAEHFSGSVENVYIEQFLVSDEIESRAIEVSGASGVALSPAVPILRDTTMRAIGRAVDLRSGAGLIFDNVQITVVASSDERVAAISMVGADTFELAAIKVEGSGLAIKNRINRVALYSDIATENYFRTDSLIGDAGLVYERSEIMLEIENYDRSWIPGWRR